MEKLDANMLTKQFYRTICNTPKIILKTYLLCFYLIMGLILGIIVAPYVVPQNSPISNESLPDLATISAQSAISIEPKIIITSFQWQYEPALSPHVITPIKYDGTTLVGYKKPTISNSDVDVLARLVYAEARGVGSKTEQACVIWTVLNRVDKGWGSIYSVVTAPNQFAYSSSTPVLKQFQDLARDVLNRWYREKAGETNVGRVLPKNYLYFIGYDGHNWFRASWPNGANWDYSLPSPY